MVPIAFSPGPANIALASHSLNFGINKTIGLFNGMIFSSLIISITIKLTINSFSEENIWFVYIQVIGACYIFYLSYKLFIMNYNDPDQKSQFLTYKHGIYLNILNPKFYFMVSALATQFPTQKSTDHILFIILLITLNAFGNILWILLGSAGSKFNKYRNIYIFQKYIYSISLAVLSLYLLHDSIITTI